MLDYTIKLNIGIVSNYFIHCFLNSLLQEESNELIIAANDGDITVISTLINDGVDINAVVYEVSIQTISFLCVSCMHACVCGCACVCLCVCVCVCVCVYVPSQISVNK